VRLVARNGTAAGCRDTRYWRSLTRGDGAGRSDLDPRTIVLAAVRLATKLGGTWKHRRRGAYRVVPAGHQRAKRVARAYATPAKSRSSPGAWAGTRFFEVSRERVRQILGTHHGPDPHDRVMGLTVQVALGLQRAAARTTITSFASAVCAAGRVPLDIGAQALRPV
jgi:hypothetical protein